MASSEIGIINSITPEKPLLIAHRGGRFYRPENTLAAFEYIADRSVEWVECDVRMSRDGEPVLVHDESISDQNGFTHAVHELSWRQLKSLDVGGGEGTPRLKELLKLLGDRLHFDLEVKEIGVVEPVIRLVSSMGLQDRCVITSFILEALQLAREIAPNISRGLLVDRLAGKLTGSKTAVRAAALLECAWFLPHYRRLTPAWVKAASEANMLVVTWTVNNDQDAKKMLEMGVSGIISDRPDQFDILLKN